MSMKGTDNRLLMNEKEQKDKGKDIIRILHVFGSLDKGGAESRTMDIYRELDKTKIQFDFLVTNSRQKGVESNYYYQEIISMGGCVVQVEPWRCIGMIEYYRRWKQLLTKKKYSIVHAHSGLWAGVALIPAWLNGVPKRIAHARDAGLDMSVSRVKLLYYHILRFVVNVVATDKIYCSREAARFAFGKNIGKREHFYYLPNAINLSLFEAISDADKGALQKELGLSDEDCVVGTVGNSKPVKNHIFLVKAFHRFLSRIPNAKLLIVGKEERDEEAKQYVADHGIDSAVIFLGQRDDVPSLLQLMDVFVLPSVKEGAPGVVIEAQAANVPCILSDSITRDVDVGTGLLKYIPLSAPLDVWAKEIADSCKSTRPLRDDTLEKLRSAGYDVSYSCKKLLEIYGIA